MSREYRVRWRWREDPDGPVATFTRERERVYRTRGGADRRIALLTKDGGRFENDRNDGYGPVDVYQLDYVRLDVREVGDWGAVDGAVDGIS